jgi:hypothetical protein
MNRTDIINHYLGKLQFPRSYLEIGVRNKGHNFNLIQADHKDGVDPNWKSHCNYIMTSDEFFSKNITKYDLIFIDGLHLYEQVYRDVVFALKFLKEKGIIIMHDCNPPDEWAQREHHMRGVWWGTAWKAFVRIRSERDDIEMFVVDVDAGVGVLIPNSKQKLFQCSENIYDYKIFNKYRKEALNLISVDEFKKKEAV